MSRSLELARPWLGQHVTVTMDRPIGSLHPRHGYRYPVNYGYLAGIEAPDGEDLDAYYLGVDDPRETASGQVIAIIHRRDDDDDKLVVVPVGMTLDDAEILNAVVFQEQWFDVVVIRR